MYSGIKERINNYKKLSEEEKKELKQLCVVHHDRIREFLENTEVPYSVRNALEDRLIELSNIIFK